ncbi:MAG: divalent metal cation transporter [Candidatus Levybacteria bacterium]|nr:divalent metal cation transporter [Candidatus Levybacteria bacterium]
MKFVKKIIKILGPGFITGASDDDPSGIATYSQTGALFGFSQLWTAPFSFPLMVAAQEMCGRIGLVTGRGLAGVIRQYYTKKVLYGAVLLLFVANTINIGADLGAMAASLQLILGLPFWMLLISIAVITLCLEVFISYKTYAQYLKYLTFALFSYFFVVLTIHINWKEVFSSTVFPTVQFTKDYLLNIVAILGTTISPYLFFWQASEEVEEEVAHHKLRQMGAGQPKVTPKDISRLRMDTIIGMFFSNLVMWFIIIATGATLFTQGIKTIQTASDAALALRPIASDFAFLLFALGIIGTGFLAVPILAGSASYAVSEAFGWKAGLYRTPKTAPQFYLVIVIATVIGITINFIGISPFSALYYTAVLNGIVAPPLLFIILIIANNKEIMGNRVNNRLLNIIGIVTIIIMAISAIGLLLTFL